MADSSFTYYAHPLYMRGIESFGNYLSIDVSETWMFFLTVILTYIGAFIIYKWDNKFVKQIVM